MSKHTPAPWFIWKEKATEEECLSKEEISDELLSADDYDIMIGKPIGSVERWRVKGCQTLVSIDADFLSEDMDREEILANARLIAAAPELFEALQGLLDAYSDPGNTGSTHDDKVEAARAAIAKARGE